MSYYLIESKSFDLIKQQRPLNTNHLKETHLAFSGTLKQHPYDETKVILISEPYSNNTSYYEFEKSDIGLIEELPNIVNSNEEDISMVLLWVEKGCIGIRSSLFKVEAVNIKLD